MNTSRYLGVAIAILSVWAGASAQLSTLFGQTTANVIVTVCTLTVATLGAVLGVINNQTNTVTLVKSMPGVDKIEVNAQANPALAKMALDPTVDKIKPAPGAEAKLTQIAQAAE